MKNKVNISTIESYIEKYIQNKKPSNLILNKYRKSIGINKNSFFLGKLGVEKKIKKCDIIFIADRPNYFFSRVALALKKKGFRTCMISRWGVSKHEGNFFNLIVLYDKFTDLKILRKNKKSKIYVQTWPGYNFLPTYIHLIVNRDIACNINDLTYTLFKNKKNLKLIGLKNREANFDIECEKYILKNINFVTSFYIDNRIFYKYGTSVIKRLKKNISFFPCYPTKEFFYNKNRICSNNKLSFFYSGGLPAKNKPDKIFKDAKLAGTIDKILYQDYYLTIFNNPQLFILDNKKMYKKKYSYLINQTKKNAKLTYKTGFFPWDMKKHTQKFNFALFPFYFNKMHTRIQTEGSIMTKVYTYLEQCLPMVVTYKQRSVYNFVKSNKLGITIKNEDELNNFDQVILNNLNKYKYFIQNIKKFRNKYSMDIMTHFIVRKMKI